MGGEVEGAGALVRQARGAAPRREYGLLELDREPVFGLGPVPLPLERVAALPHGPLVAA